MTIINQDRPNARNIWQIQHVALCCECGTQRSTTARGGTGDKAEDGTRCIVNRKCATCKKITAHAYLRNDDYRDVAEAPGLPEPGSEPERPFWLTEQCPTWCTRRHSSLDGGSARYHEGLGRFWVLPFGLVLAGDDRDDGHSAGDRPYIVLCLRQDVRAHGLPNMVMQIGTGERCETWEMDRDLAASVMVHMRDVLGVIDETEDGGS